MLSRLRPRSIYDVMAAIACFTALAGGTAYAANTVFSADIVDGQVKSVDVGDGEILSADVKDQSLTTFDVSTFLGADVVDNTLTGDDINESTLVLAVDPVTPVPASGTNGFANQWGNDPDYGGPAGYWKDPIGVVHLRGTVGRLGDMSGPRIFTLPDGYRPPFTELFPVATPAGTAAQIQVSANGQVQAYSGAANDLSLDGITFRP